MKGYVISGIQQVGIGVTDLYEAWNWYIDHFGMDCRIFEDDSVAKLMLPYTGGKPQSRHAILAMNLQSGGGFEVWQYKGRTPVMLTGGVSVGDIGILACKMKVKNIGEAYSFFKSRGVKTPEKIFADPAGRKSFFVKDPFGNAFQMTEGEHWLMNEDKVSGGSYGVVIGVSDIERSRVVYSDILGYDEIIFDSTATFEDLSVFSGENRECRRILLKRSEPFAGPFSKLFGPSLIELISPTGSPGKKLYENRYWGDPGFIHLCYDVRGMDSLKEYCALKGHPFTVDSKQSHEGSSFDMGEAAGFFSYIEDPDGNLIEFVETHKIPILKKLGLYLDLRKRDPRKSLPMWILKSLRFSRVKKPVT